MNTVIVTGASSGIGKEFVKQIADSCSPDEIWVIARRKARLEQLQNIPNVKIRPVVMDLTDKANIDQLGVMLEEEKPVVSKLVNAGGFGRFGAFTDISLEDQYEMIDLNIKALTGITYTVLPFMKKGSEIYQIASLSSFQPVPYINVYGATKAYVLSFSRALNVELKSRGIKVIAVCPGWVKTEFFDRAATDDTITYYNKMWGADAVVRKALSDIKKGKDVSVLGLRTRIQVLLTKFLPHRTVMKVWCRQQKK